MCAIAISMLRSSRSRLTDSFSRTDWALPLQLFHTFPVLQCISCVLLIPHHSVSTVGRHRGAEEAGEEEAEDEEKDEEEAED
jgi:hypothetical protein